MTDWEKLKVTDLKEELRSRGVPLTGLKLKQQLIDKLVELESNAENPNGEDQAEAQTGNLSEAANDDTHEEQSMTTKPPHQDDTNIEPPQEHDSTTDDTASINPPTLLRIEDLQAAKLEDAPIPSENHTPAAEQHDPFLVQDDVKMTDSKQSEERQDEKTLVEMTDADVEPPSITENETDEHPSAENDPIQSQPGEQFHGTHETTVSTRVPTPEILDDQRKRKRRSVTPTPDPEDMARKKARTSNEQVAVSLQEASALEQIKAATDEAQANRAGNSPDEQPLEPMEASSDAAKTDVAKRVGGLPDASELDAETSVPMQADSTSQAIEDYRDVSPSIHPATSSLYIRNFKRPLHIPTLRAHIASLAKVPSHEDSDPIQLFYLDNIRTHAFVTFTSVSAASRVRSAMHDTRFPPDEQLRDPLWIDFIPDEVVQSWIDQETGSGGTAFGGGRGRGGKFEVVYTRTATGVEATLEDSSQSARSNPTFQQRQSGRALQDPAVSGPIASGVHPDRAGLVPQDLFSRSAQTTAQRHRSPPRSSKPAVSDSGKGFTALDSLFSSTQTKPKLYYKAAPQSIVNSRMDLLRDLHVGHSEMGRSGDEGMKRYTFEQYKDTEEWVDKGPEFGYGRKGQDRLEGLGRGGYRGGRGGGGGFRGRRGGDSWRGGR